MNLIIISYKTYKNIQIIDGSSIIYAHYIIISLYHFANIKYF